MENRVIRTLQDLVRFDTTNPPGNETPCAEYIRDRLVAEGVEAVILEAAPGRGSVIARLKGDGTERPLLLLSHLDVVRAEPERWTHPPFGGDLADGFVWGRGTLDMKGLTAIQLELFLEIKRRGLPLKRDIILAAAADEETGGAKGVGWLVENHWDLIAAEYAINEGGGFGMQIGDRWLFTCQTAEKGVFWTKIKARGAPGHASTPMELSAVGKIAAAVDKLARARLPQHRVATVESFVHALSQLLPPPADREVLGLFDPETEQKALDLLPSKTLAYILRASVRNTATPTMLRAGEKINVIPSEAEAGIAAARAALAAAQEPLTVSGSNESKFDTPLFRIIGEVIGEFQPNSVVAPFMSTGGTDSRYLAWKGVNAYGFYPKRFLPGEPSFWELVHAHDERISVENIRFGTQVLWEVVTRLCQR